MTVQKRRLAVSAGEAWRARAGVRTLAGVKAGAAVHAGLVIRAIVQVLVAEQSAPAFVAKALPGFLAATMKAAWISHALVAVRSLPAVVASGIIKNGCCSLAIRAFHPRSGESTFGCFFFFTSTERNYRTKKKGRKEGREDVSLQGQRKSPFLRHRIPFILAIRIASHSKTNVKDLVKRV